MSADLASLYIKVDSSGVVTASRDLEKLTGVSKQAEGAQKGLETQSRKTEKATAALTKGFAAMAVTMAATWAAANAWSMAKLGAELEETRGILNNLSKQYKTTADDIVAAMARASQGLIANSDLMRTALGGLAKGLNPEQLIKLSGAAAILGDTIGRSATVALKELTEALESGRTMGLYVYGKSALDLGDAFGKLEGKMSAAERAQAMYLLVMIHATKLQKQQTEAVNDAANKFESMEAKYRNYADTFSVVIMKMTVRLGDYLVAVGKAAQKTAQFFGLTDLPSGATRDYANPKDELADYKKQLADLKALLAKKPSAGGDNAAASVQKLREEYEKTKQSLEEDISLAGMEGIRKEFQQNLIAYEKTIEASKKYSKAEQAVIEALAKEKKALADKGVIDKAAMDSRKDNAAAIEKERQEIESLIDAYRGLMNALDPFESINDKYQWSISMLNDAFGKGVITEPQYQSATESVKTEKDLLDAKTYADFYAEIQGYEDEYRRKQFEAIEAEQKLRAKYYKDDVAAAKWAAEQKDKFSRDELDAIGEKFDYNTRYINETIANTGKMIDSAMTMYDEESSEYKRLAEAKKVIQIAELAMTMAKNAQIIASNLGLVASNTAVSISNAGAAVTGASIGVGPTGFATAAAMIALMASVFAMYGIASGGSASASAPAPKTYNYGGDAGPLGTETGTASESLANSLEKVEGSLDNIFNVEDVKLQKIYNELRSLNQNITGLVSSIFRTGTGDFSSFGLKTGETFTDRANFFMNVNDEISSFFSGSWAADKLGIGEYDLLGKLTFGINSFIDKAYSKVFGGSVETKLQKGGIEFGDVLVSSVMDGMSVSARQFARYKITKDGGWFGSDKTSYKTKYAALDDDVVNMLTKMFDSIGTTLITVAEGLGANIQAAENYIFKSAQLNLKGMSADEMSEALSNYFSEMADKAASDLFGTIIKEYQQVNEALFETAVRLVRDKTTVMNILSATGHGIQEITTSVIKTREVISSEWTKWETDRAKWAKSWVGRLTLAMGGSYKTPEPDKYVTQTYQEITSNAQAIIELSESLIELAGGLDVLTENAETYYNAFYSEAEKSDLLKGQLTDAFTEMNMAFPATRSGFRDIVESLDLTTEAGQKTYVAMLSMADAADQYYSYIDEIVEDLKSARESMQLKGLQAEMDRSVSSRLAFMRILDQVREGNYANIGNISDVLDDYKEGATNTNLYATKQDYEREFYKTYNSIAEMEGILGGTKSIDEQQLDVLKEIAGQLGSKLYKTGATTNETILATEKAGMASTVSTTVKQAPQAKILFGDFGNGISMADIFPMGFAEGGSFSGGYRIVGENGPELEFTGPSQIVSNSKSKALLDNSEVVKELKSLREDIKAYGYAIAKNTGKSAKVSDRWDIDGLPAERTIT